MKSISSAVFWTGGLESSLSDRKSINVSSAYTVIRLTCTVLASLKRHSLVQALQAPTSQEIDTCRALLRKLKYTAEPAVVRSIRSAVSAPQVTWATSTTIG